MARAKSSVIKANQKLVLKRYEKYNKLHDTTTIKFTVWRNTTGVSFNTEKEARAFFDVATPALNKNLKAITGKFARDYDLLLTPPL